MHLRHWPMHQPSYRDRLSVPEGCATSGQTLIVDNAAGFVGATRAGLKRNTQGPETFRDPHDDSWRWRDDQGIAVAARSAVGTGMAAPAFAKQGNEMAAAVTAAGTAAPTRRAGAMATRRVGVAATCRQGSTKSTIPTLTAHIPAAIAAITIDPAAIPIAIAATPTPIAALRIITGTLGTTAISRGERLTHEPGLRGRALRFQAGC
jgi:hypothetical protein